MALHLDMPGSVSTYHMLQPFFQLRAATRCNMCGRFAMYKTAAGATGSSGAWPNMEGFNSNSFSNSFSNPFNSSTVVQLPSAINWHQLPSASRRASWQKFQLERLRCVRRRSDQLIHRILLEISLLEISWRSLPQNLYLFVVLKLSMCFSF